MPAPKEKGKANRHMDVLAELLHIDENKSCNDCETRGPRWASWNLGIFLCIRCAGIHRNLGVHISRVKSVNLDSWTPQQVARMQDIGNALAKKVYEAHLPDNFRRPQTDSALEQFIRSKYQDKRYIDREWKPPAMRDQPTYLTNATQSKSTPPSNRAGDRKVVLKANDTLPHTQSSPSFDLLNLDNEEKQTSSSADKQNNLSVPRSNLSTKSPSADDLFGDFVSSSVASSNVAAPAGDKQENTENALQNKSGYSDLSGLDFGPGFGNLGGANNIPSTLESNIQPTESKPKSTKESILALYAKSNTQSSQAFNSAVQQNQNIGGQQFGQFEAPPPNYLQHQLMTSSSSTNQYSAITQPSIPGSGTSTSNSQLLLGELGGAFNTGPVNTSVGQNAMFGLQHNPFFASTSGETSQTGFNQQNMSSLFSGLHLNSSSQAPQFYNPPANHQNNSDWANVPSGQTFATNLWQ